MALSIRLLFLDVDGVINHHGCKDEFSKELLTRLYQIVELTQCKIVISSTYRMADISKRRLWNALENVGISKNEYSLSDYQATPDLLDYNLERTDEIIDIINKISKDNKYKLMSWIALDDGDLLNQGKIENRSKMENHFVITDPKTGLINENVIKSINLLLQ